MPDDQLLTTSEVARYLHMRPRTVSNLAQSGKLPARKVGNRWRFAAADVRAYDERTAEHEGEEQT